MPRATTKRAIESEAEVVVRAPRRKVATRAPRKTAAKIVKTEANESATVTRRKAPSRVIEEESVRPKAKREKSLYVSGALFSMGFLAAALIGYSDQGQINPAAVIAERNARLTAGVADSGTQEGVQVTEQVIPVQNTSTQKNGGLVPSAVQPGSTQLPVIDEVATSTATSSIENASTTDEGEVGESENTDTVAPEAVMVESETETTPQSETTELGVE